MSELREIICKNCTILKKCKFVKENGRCYYNADFEELIRSWAEAKVGECRQHAHTNNDNYEIYKSEWVLKSDIIARIREE